MKVGYWGGSFGLAHDTDGSGGIRGSQPGERGVRFTIGTQANVQFRLVAADQSFVQVPVANAGIAGGDWVSVRVVMDFTAGGGTGIGTVWCRNISAGATDFSQVPGLDAIPLGLDLMATDARNPSRWDAVWLHFEGATYGLDNIEVGRAGFAIPYGGACSGVGGPVTLTAQGTFRPGSTSSLVSDNHAPGKLGVAVYGLSDAMHAGQPLPIAIDPLFGTNGCFLHTSIDVTLAYLTGTGTPATLTSQVVIPRIWTGWRFFAQHVCFENVPGGMSWSNGLLVQVP